MCTAVTYRTDDFYFGRTLDHDCSYGEQVTITPRDYPFHFRYMGRCKHHYAIIGTAYIAEDYPLYYDAVNEKGLGMAGLHFIGNAVYGKKQADQDNVAPFEFIPWILSQCASVAEAKQLLKTIHLVHEPFNDQLPVAELHWMIADSIEAVTVEAGVNGLKVYQNPVGVLTNNPPFPEQLFQLNNYMHLSANAPQNHFSDQLPLRPYSLGMGALGLPGDTSSQSRFVRAAFVKWNAVCDPNEAEIVSQFFHILGAVDQPRGCSRTANGSYEYTLYTSCCNASKGIYYYTTYDHHQITAVDLHREILDAERLIRYPMLSKELIRYQNG